MDGGRAGGGGVGGVGGATCHEGIRSHSPEF